MKRGVKIDSQVQQFTKKKHVNHVLQNKRENDELNESSRAVKQHCQFKIAIRGIIS